MADLTKIEWCDATLNLWWGCTKVSDGCKFCYAEHLADQRYNKGNWGPKGTRTEVKSWRSTLNKISKRAILEGKRLKVFCQSMSDTFEGPDTCGGMESENYKLIQGLQMEFFNAIEAHPELDFLILTKRPENVLEVLAGWNYCRELIGKPEWERFPNNVWLGTSVEDQKTADERIPALMRCPAAIRFLSCEPLIGPVDLTGWSPNTAVEQEMPDKWEDHDWPEWIPEKTRALIVNFWGPNMGRNPSQWARDNVTQKTPATGTIVQFGEKRLPWVLPYGKEQSIGSGRWVHRWNNMGSIVTDDGDVLCASASQGRLFLQGWLQNGEYRPLIHWVICGGESGSDARPMHAGWARSLRDQCKSAGVAYFFKQWGEFCAVDQLPETFKERNADYDPPKVEIEGINLFRVGKAKAGRLLDGVEHNEFPEVGNAIQPPKAGRDFGSNRMALIEKTEDHK